MEWNTVERARKIARQKKKHAFLISLSLFLSLSLSLSVSLSKLSFLSNHHLVALYTYKLSFLSKHRHGSLLLQVRQSSHLRQSHHIYQNLVRSVTSTLSSRTQHLTPHTIFITESGCSDPPSSGDESRRAKRSGTPWFQQLFRQVSGGKKKKGYHWNLRGHMVLFFFLFSPLLGI